MKEHECTHFVDSIVYLMEQTATYCNAKGTQFFAESNIGISLDQYTIIDTVSFNPGICQSDLAKLILRDRSYTSRLLNTLEKDGFIERKIETKGKRLVKQLYITDKATTLLEENQGRLKNLFLQAFGSITDEEFAAIRSGLEKMKECISKNTVIQF